MRHGGPGGHGHPATTLLVHSGPVQRRVAEQDSGSGAGHCLLVPGLCEVQSGMKWLDNFPLLILVALAAWMAVAPITPEPHLIEKLRMLGQGTLTKPLDIFDLCLHSAPLVLLALRLWRQFARR
jgi:hypothetical protein